MNRRELFGLILILVISYGSEAQGIKTRELSTFATTDFLPTLEHEFAKNRNAVYCSSFLYAWDQIRNIIKAPIKIDSSLHDLYLVNKSRSYVNTLTKNEYSAKAEIRGPLILVKSEFQKSLPFKNEFVVSDEPLVFNGKRVPSFGVDGSANTTIQILYYNNDSDFMIKILMKDDRHEILLSMSESDYKSFADIVRDVKRRTDRGKVEMRDEGQRWKYCVTYYDMVSIPILKFDINANYGAMVGNKFIGGEKVYKIEASQQRIVFSLNKEGVELETESDIEAVVFLERAMSESIKPKLLRFNKPFFLMLKRTDCDNPYFAFWVANDELMVTK